MFSISGRLRGSSVLSGTRRQSLVPCWNCQLGFRLWPTKPARCLHQGHQVHFLDLQPYQLIHSLPADVKIFCYWHQIIHEHLDSVFCVCVCFLVRNTRLLLLLQGWWVTKNSPIAKREIVFFPQVFLLNSIFKFCYNEAPRVLNTKIILSCADKLLCYYQVIILTR